MDREVEKKKKRKTNQLFDFACLFAQRESQEKKLKKKKKTNNSM